MNYTPVVSFITGALSTALASWLQHFYTARAQRLDREAQTRLKREERQEQLYLQQLDRLRDLYRRTAQLGLEYRQFHGGGDPAHWREFIARFVGVKGELELDGSAEVREAFRVYLDKVQEAEYEAMQGPPEEEFWQHYDRDLEQLTLVMRNDLARRTSTPMLASAQAPLLIPEAQRGTERDAPLLGATIRELGTSRGSS